MKLLKFIVFVCSFFLVFSSNLIAQYSIVVKRDTLEHRINFLDRKSQQDTLINLIKSLSVSNYTPLKIINDTTNRLESILQIGSRIMFQVFLADSIVEKTKTSNLLKQDPSFSLNNYQILAERIVTYYENNGFPFVKVNPFPTLINDSLIHIALSVDLGPLVKYDSIDLKGNTKISNRFLVGYLGLKKGKIYNENEIKLIKKRLTKLSFLKLEKHPQFAFIDQKLLVLLYVSNKKSSQFDGIIGLLPQSGLNQKTLITGDVKLNLKNIFNNAEQIELNWRRSDPLSQDLFIGSSIPYIFGSNYGVKFNFKLNKKDTTTLTNTTKIGGNYYFLGLNNVTAYFENSNSKLLSTTAINQNGNINSNIDYSVNRYGLAGELDYLDDIWIPTKGVKIEIDINIGTRKTIMNSKIPEDYYTNITKSETQIKAFSSIESYFPIYKHLIFNITQKNFYLSGNNRYENELFRFGGLTSLRGFNEESLLASTACMLNTELRWLVDRSTYLFVFWNGAYYEKRTVGKFLHDTPNGTGIGLSFDTPAGIFNITYALGKEFNNPIQIKYAKIHFGIVARF